LECSLLIRADNPPSVGIDRGFAFRNGTALTEVVVIPEGHLRTIGGFQESVSLCRIKIPSSVEISGMLVAFSDRHSSFW
jgi:hypothetical protein